MKLRTTLFTLLPLLIISCSKDNRFRIEDDYSTVPDPYSTAGVTPDTTASGLIIYNLETGTGELDVTTRDNVRVFYTGRKTNGEIFDSSYKNGQTTPLLRPVLGFVEGFAEGLLDMKEGGIRVLILPPDLAYEGTTNILRDDTLRFDVELDTIIF